MTKEHETKVLDINPKEIDKKLLSLGAEKIKRNLMRRWTFDWVDKDPDMINEWVRLRDEGDKITLTYKNRNSKTKVDTDEISVDVSDFDKASELLKKLPFKRKFYQENYRTAYRLGDIEFMIDEWPNLEPHLEVEGKTMKDVEKGLSLLGLEGKDIGDVSVNMLYKKKGIILHDIAELRFEAKR